MIKSRTGTVVPASFRTVRYGNGHPPALGFRHSVLARSGIHGRARFAAHGNCFVRAGDDAWRPGLRHRGPGRGAEPAAERVLGVLGAAMVAGYLAERLARRRLLPSGWDAAETPVVIAGMGLAAVMALLSLRSEGTQAKAS